MPPQSVVSQGEVDSWIYREGTRLPFYHLLDGLACDGIASLGWRVGAIGRSRRKSPSVDHAGAGVEVNSAFIDGVTLTNAIIVSRSVGLQVSEDTTVTVSGVLWHDNITNTVTTSATVQVSGVFTGSPAFAADGYHLTAGSMAIDRGVNAGVTVDIDGDLRGGTLGLGADELAKRRIYLPLVVRNG